MYPVSGTLVSSCTTAQSSSPEWCDQYGSTCSLGSQPEGESAQSAHSHPCSKLAF